MTGKPSAICIWVMISRSVSIRRSGSSVNALSVRPSQQSIVLFPTPVTPTIMTRRQSAICLHPDGAKFPTPNPQSIVSNERDDSAVTVAWPALIFNGSLTISFEPAVTLNRVLRCISRRPPVTSTEDWLGSGFVTARLQRLYSACRVVTKSRDS
jgi:hypothetical protein